ncbi:MAG: SH3 domain-containing protein [Gallionella sp.]|nr:SH3 domain-containing protein [Gallionella sp.]
MRFNLLVTTALLIISGMVQAAESGTTVKKDSVRAAPFSDAKIVVTLPAATKVEILKKDGGWYQIKSAQGNGWMRMLSIRRGDINKPSAGSSASALAGLASGRSGTGKVVATTGIRGLNEEQLKAAHYDENQVTLLEASTSSRAEAQKFAARARLKARQMDYLADPGGSK